MIAGELVRGRALDRVDVRRVADVEIDIAAELERAGDDRARPDHDARVLALAPRPAVLLLDQEPALDTRIRSDREVAAARLDAAADMRGIERDASVDVRGLAGDVRAVRQRDVAVDRLDRARDVRALTELDSAVDRFDR